MAEARDSRRDRDGRHLCLPLGGLSRPASHV